MSEDTRGPTNSAPPGHDVDDIQTIVGTFPSVEPHDFLWSRIKAEIRGDKERRNRLHWAAAFAGIAALVVAVVASVSLVADRTSGASETPVTVAAVRELVDGTGEVVLRSVSQPDGRTVVTAVSLDALPNDQTYQLWSVVGDEVVSVGLFGPNPTTHSIRIESEPAALALSIETAGGVAVSTNQPVGVWVASEA